MTPDTANGEEARALLASMPFARMVGVEAISDRPDEVRGRLSWRPETCTTGEVMHGGALMTLAAQVTQTQAVLSSSA